jgi:hypothetical protein
VKSSGVAGRERGFPVLGWLFQAGTAWKSSEKNFEKTAFFLEKVLERAFFWLAACAKLLAASAVHAPRPAIWHFVLAE